MTHWIFAWDEKDAIALMVHFKLVTDPKYVTKVRNYWDSNTKMPELYDSTKLIAKLGVRGMGEPIATPDGESFWRLTDFVDGREHDMLPNLLEEGAFSYLYQPKSEQPKVPKEIPTGVEELAKKFMTYLQREKPKLMVEEMEELWKVYQEGAYGGLSMPPVPRDRFKRHYRKYLSEKKKQD
jgi:hypothetical protein